VRRGVFILVSMIVPIIANGFRGIGIVYLGYLLGSAQAAAADHIIYGWIFFSIVILLLIALGLPFRQDDISTRSASSQADPDAAAVFSLRGVFAVALGLVVIAAVSPVVAAGLTRAAATPVSTAARIEVGSDCSVQPAASGDAAIGSQRVVCGDVKIDMSWQAFSPHVTAGPLMAARRRMVAGAMTEGLQERWLNPADGSAGAWRLMSSNDPAYVTAVAVWVDGKAVRPGLAMRLRMALNSLTGSRYAPMVVTLTPVANWETHNMLELKAAEAALPRFLRAHPELDATVGTLSALR
jgi:hypothetical protein